MSFLSYLRECFFPFGCGACGEVIINSEEAVNGLCADCRANLTFSHAEEKYCENCGKPLISEKVNCLSCRAKAIGENNSENYSFHKLRVLFPYTGKFRTILGSYKFGKSVNIGNFLAQQLISSIRSMMDGFDANTLNDLALIPVPPRPGKIKSQGWDQIEYLAKLLQRDYKRSINPVPVRRCLERLVSRKQKELNREERNINLKGRLICINKPPKTAILFDDVITTGATLNACADALLEKGTVQVYAICLFYD
jgi:ComF family protein